MRNNEFTIERGQESALSTNKVLRQTYMLLSMTLLFSGLTAGVSMALNPPVGLSMIASLVSLGLLWFVVPRTANSASGIWVVFLVTGLLGFGLGPILNHYVALPNGGQLVMTALGGTGVVFLGLSGYALVSRRDFSFMGGFLVVGLVVVLAAMLGNIFLEIPALSMAISAAIVLLMSGFILYDTGRMVNGGEDNYLLLTVSLYLNIFNLFVHLLSLLGMNQND